MPKLPIVAIIGKPNSGKSSLFNRLIRKWHAIVSDIPGTTRDTIVHRIETQDLSYLLLDTGGIGGGSRDKDLEDDVERQAHLAIENADLVVFVLDALHDLTASDYAVADVLRKQKRGHVPVLLVLSKCDNPERADELLPHVYSLGIAEDVIVTSAVHRMGIDQLETEIVHALQKLHFGVEAGSDERAADSCPRIAVVGTPNVGKSSLINAFMTEGQRKSASRIVSNLPGTTRDASDTLVKHDGKEYLFVDTAGMRRKAHVKEDIESYAYLRSIKAVEQSDIVVLVLDAQDRISRQDKRLARMALEEGKGLLILLNKIDTLAGEEREAKTYEVRRALSFCQFVPLLPCSAETREGLLKIFDLLALIQINRARRIPTKELHNWYEQVAYGQSVTQLSSAKHITQASDIPPTFVLFTKQPKKIQLSHLRYLENQMRSTFGFEGTPIRWVTKAG
ncbi:ribosome biogenesis GTPase Der [Candidatus Peregrinibacteria bacterium CG10_big_fil_rev_8_21_14_0_10_49_16]|nr:MAG: ribosome biogenesis GTPase Der [Candidatus Peregrinibacteria bacterium CG22_combo_CG10-13_8_21_14_all_49_11]PIR52291.1 MAG: ribosome biogenesis GTPase Der [Candidatus Peregrinibacteria bacterium CG10_big_fil_rev_8_21_14_0_10_49_16]